MRVLQAGTLQSLPCRAGHAHLGSTGLAPLRKQGGEALVGGEIVEGAIATHEVEADAAPLHVRAHLDRPQAVANLHTAQNVSKYSEHENIGYSQPEESQTVGFAGATSQT